MTNRIIHSVEKSFLQANRTHLSSEGLVTHVTQKRISTQTHLSSGFNSKKQIANIFRNETIRKLPIIKSDTLRLISYQGAFLLESSQLSL